MIDPGNLFRGIVMTASLVSVVTHADGFALMLKEMLDIQCGFCGYRYDHPIVRHQPGYKGKECGWR
jgi:hypothetical protein